MKLARYVLAFIGMIYILNAVLMWVMPEFWYNLVPGVSMMGPYNSHFVRDIGLIYGLSGYALFAASGEGRALWFGAIWPALHGVFHIWIWVSNGFAIDIVLVTNILAIQLPAWAAVWAIWKLQKS
jgi:hypothetical protein